MCINTWRTMAWDLGCYWSCKYQLQKSLKITFVFFNILLWILLVVGYLVWEGPQMNLLCMVVRPLTRGAPQCGWLWADLPHSHMSWLYNGGHGLVECTLSLSGEVAKVHSLGFTKMFTRRVLLCHVCTSSRANLSHGEPLNSRDVHE